MPCRQQGGLRQIPFGFSAADKACLVKPPSSAARSSPHGAAVTQRHGRAARLAAAAAACTRARRARSAAAAAAARPGTAAAAPRAPPGTSAAPAPPGRPAARAPPGRSAAPPAPPGRPAARAPPGRPAVRALAALRKSTHAGISSWWGAAHKAAKEPAQGAACRTWLRIDLLLRRCIVLLLLCWGCAHKQSAACQRMVSNAHAFHQTSRRARHDHV